MNKKFVLALSSLLATASILTAQDLRHPEGPRHQKYRFVDLGTFGGPASFIDPTGAIGGPNQVNSSGTVVGGSDLPIPTTALSSGYACYGPEGTQPFVDHAFQWKDGVLSDLGALGTPDKCSVATSINDSGLIAGVSENDVIDPIFGQNEFRAVVWENGRIEDLGTFGGNASAAGDVNNKGQVVGWALTSKLDPFSLILVNFGGGGPGPQTQAFLWQKGHMRNLGTLGGLDAMAFLVNDRGQVAGWSYTNEDPNPTTGFPTLHPFLWEDGKMLDLGTLGGTAGGSIALNNRGQVVGVSNLAGDQASDLFLWDKGKLTDLTAQSGGSFVFANAINDAGQIAGGAFFPGRDFDAAVWQNGVLTDLGTLDGDCISVAWAMNSRGQIVGTSLSCEPGKRHAFLWQNGSMFDLNALIPADSSLELMDPLAIGDNGEIAGIGVVPGSGCNNPYACGVAFVLQPTDEVVTVTTSGATAQSGKSRTAGLGFREIMAQIEARTGRLQRLPGLAPVRGSMEPSTQH